LNCEICGKRIEGKPRKVMIDNSILEVCASCANLGEREVKEKPRERYSVRQQISRGISKIDLEEMEVVSDYASIIRKARERMGLSQDDLAQKVNEKASVIRLIESGKMKPNFMMSKKLEHALRVDLFTMIEEE